MTIRAERSLACSCALPNDVEIVIAEIGDGTYGCVVAERGERPAVEVDRDHADEDDLSRHDVIVARDLQVVDQARLPDLNKDGSRDARARRQGRRDEVPEPTRLRILRAQASLSPQLRCFVWD